MDSGKGKIRKAAVAGSFYPGTAIELSKALAVIFSEVDKVILGGAPRALIVPHAGYPYSGKTAAKAFKLLEGLSYDTVVVISPSHTVFFKGSSVYEGDGYETPLGVVEIDRELSDRIGSIHPSVYLSTMGHASGATRGEHALEVQLPFLQLVLGKFKLVAIVMGDQERDSVNSLGEVLSSTLEGTNSLMVASSDLSHFHSEQDARKLDLTVQTALEKYDPKLLMKVVEEGQGEACGAGVMAAVMMAGKRLGAEESKFLEYTTSGETTGEFGEVVGYLSAALLASKTVSKTRVVLGQPAAIAVDKDEILDEEKVELKKIAYNAIKAHLSDKKYKPEAIKSLESKRGLFVTIMMGDRLRGCIGRIKGDQALYDGVAEMSVAAAFEDPRFGELTAEELKQIDIEISVLSPLLRVHNFNKIEVGRHGLLIKMDMNSGLLLPQVASDHGWNSTEFLEQTCLKAGLPKNSYRKETAEVYSFTAQVF